MAVPSIVSWLDENWRTIECQFYGGVQQGALSAAYTSVFTGKFPLALGLAGISYAAGWSAEQAGCRYVEPQPDQEPAIGGCQKIVGGNGKLYYNRTDYDDPGAPIGSNCIEILGIDDVPNGVGGQPCWRVRYQNGDADGNPGTEGSYIFYKSGSRFPLATLIPYKEGTCEIPAPDNGPGEHNPGDPIAEPITHIVGGCNWTIQATDAYVDDQMVWHTYYVISSYDDSCGGPFAYWSSDKGPDWVAPNPPNPDAPDTPQPPLPPRDYNPSFDEINDDLDKIQEELERLKECACPEEPVIQGQFRTISFRSDETSPFGKSRLRKRLRYRGSEGVELSALVDHWRDFTWQSGPVRVRHTGASWGTPEVWASTESEGKRVLLHAAREAGIDPNQVGRWSARSSDSSRLGVSDTMRVDTTGGYYWITARDGSDQRPIVAVPRSDN